MTPLRRTAMRRKVAAGSGIPAEVRRAVRLRDAGKCRRCGRWLANIPASIQHRLPRGRGGNARMSNLVLLCGSATTPGSCHEWAESQRAQAYAAGWLVRTGYDTADIPMVTTDGALLWLDDAGGVIVEEADRV